MNPEIVDVEVIRPEPGYIDIYPLMKMGLPSAELKWDILDYLDPETLRPMRSRHDPGSRTRSVRHGSNGPGA